MPLDKTQERQAGPRAPHEELLLSLKRVQFQEWKHHPITAAYLKFLGDLSQAFQAEAMELFLAGNLRPPQSDVSVGNIRAIEDLRALQLEDIHKFYARDSGDEQIEQTSEASHQAV